MKTPLALLGLALCALPLLAERPARRVVAPCELTAASLTINDTVDKNANQVREFMVLVRNNSSRTVTMPSSPAFGWRVDVLQGMKGKKDWKLKAEGGPVRRIRKGDAHIVATSQSGDEATFEIPPAHNHLFTLDMPDAAKAFHSSGGAATLRLTLYWAASADLAKRVPDVPVCGLAPELTVNALLP